MSGIVLKKATALCPFCDRKFHQIDGTEERAMSIAQGARDKHVQAEHAGEAAS